MLGRAAACVLLVALAACGGGGGGLQAQAVSGALLLRDYGVKLCGREFVRAVIFTCGGSRWKRLNDADFAFEWKPHSDVTTKSKQPTFHTRNLLSQRTSSTYFSSNSPAEVLTRHAAPSKSDEPDSFNDLGVLAKVVWPRNSSSSRTRRHFSQGVAGICCSQGCTKNDIGRLC
ncbi:relaxin-3-like isoform X2 [Phyllopteryx taeniolatus]|uniref:relaxin-3-like isoform X2 n=1 Tax=Phyllopteryx taeniolatus TaxID=161469 RepID=UPI002AD29070|nr:relaxin-3-like isoform X2 [Phyllopteryx taeniolatus]